MSGPYGPVTQLPVDKERRINVHFRLPFMTKWGQSLIVTGTGKAAGTGCSSRHPVIGRAADDGMQQLSGLLSALWQDLQRHAAGQQEAVGMQAGSPNMHTTLTPPVPCNCQQAPCWAT